jgi:hypothetical protein
MHVMTIPSVGSAEPTSIARRRNDVVALLVLRDIETAGPQTGLDTLNHVAPAARLLRLSAPGYPLLHELLDAELLAPLPGSPPRYRITRAGSREAERLAERWWPLILAKLDVLERQLGAASPHRDGRPQFVSEWADGGDAATAERRAR